MKEIFLGFLVLAGIGLSGCASPKNIKKHACIEKSSVIIIRGDGDSLLIDGTIIKADNSLSMLLSPLPNDLASVRLFDGYDGIYFLKGELDSSIRKYTIIIRGDTLIIPETDSLCRSMIENDKIIIGADTILLSSPLLSGGKDLPRCIIEGDKYIVGKDTFYMPKCEKGMIIMNGDTILLDESELNNKDHKGIKIIKIVEDDSTKIKIEVNGKELTDPQKEEL